MDEVDSDTLPHIEKQNERKRSVIEFVEKNKDGARITRAGLKSKIDWLEKLLKEFQQTHDIIVSKGKIDIPYIASESGKKTIEYIKSVIKEFGTRKTVEDIDLLEVTIRCDEQNVDEEQNRRLRQLNLRLKGLNYAIQEMYNDLQGYETISKELFESKNTFLDKQWTAISSLEEEIMMVNEDAVGDVCQKALRNINTIVKHMSDMIRTSQTPSSNPGNQMAYESKLPDLKVPVFKGDYTRWNNFKDIFESLIHNKPRLATVQKMEYLKTYLDGEPLRLISAYTLSAENYNAAWNVLKKRYSNSRKLLTIHLENMRKPIGKPATAKAVKELHDSIIEGMTSITNLGIDTSTWGPIIIHLALENLDNESRSLFEEKFNDDSNEIPKLESFLKCLESRYKSLEILDSLKPKQSLQSSGSKMLYADGKSSGGCIKCKGDHQLCMCPAFLALSINSRHRLVKQNRFCFRCLINHMGRKCDPTSKPCKTCKSERHSTLLHFEKKTSTSKVNLCQEISTCESGEFLSAIGFNNEENNDVLATAMLQVRDAYGNPFTIRVLIDTGAQKNYITETLVQKLRLSRESCRTDVTGISNVKAFKVKHVVNVNVEPSFPSNFDQTIKALVMGKQLTSLVPENSITERLPEEWPDMQLADPTFMTPNQIDMVMGIGFFAKIILPEVKNGTSTNLIALNSQVGWLIFGETKVEKAGAYRNVKTLLSLTEVNKDISKFWELEEIAPQRFLSQQDEECEHLFESSHKRMDNGRYVVSIPFKADLHKISNLGSSRKRAMCRFLSLESKFRTNPSLFEEYKKFINEYVSLGHMKEIADDKTDSDVYFMPHHAVLKPESTSTKLRVVFDASAKTIDNTSLNEIMMAGPRLQDDLCTILLRWRFHKFVLTADIEKMYRQILISPSDRKYQRIFWRDHPNDCLKVYELCTVTYGTTSAPYLAVKTLQQLAKDEQHNYPEASNIVLNDFYVDDLLTGANTIQECIVLRKEIDMLLSKGGFSLKKWSSNVENVLEGVPIENKSKQMLDFNTMVETSLKTLGLIWKPQGDNFMFKVNSVDFETSKKTKTAFCSDISKIFDPLGWLAPVTIVAKMLFQSTWKENIDWNDPLPDSILKGWMSFRQNLYDIETIRIPRWIETSLNDQIELHGFCDASEDAYAAAIYVKVKTNDGNVSVNLLVAKTKVAPIRQELTVAKLELCGALLLAQLYNYVVSTFNWADKKFRAWCDSKIVLAWIHGDPSRWKIFVANRISQIQQLTSKESWSYVSTDQNSADCATRGLTAVQLKQHELWWFGPKWLKEEETTWPNTAIEEVIESTELKKKVVVANTALPNDSNVESIIKRFSSLHRMKYTIAFCMRFIHNCKGINKRTGSLTKEEIENSELTIIKQVQLVNYEEDLKNISNKRQLNNKSGILSLSPMIDNQGLLRVLGRLQNSYLCYDEKHPLILPRKSHLSYLIVVDAHRRCNHGLNSLTEYIVRRRFWIVQLKSLIKTITFHCVICRRKSPQRMNQMMGQFPENRITFNNAFYSSGVDYAGPFDTKSWKGRCNKKYKSYVCVFVCMATKAVHLELISDLTAEGFMAGYRRFSARRGPCLHIHSDCGTNFIGANKMIILDLKKFQDQWLNDIKPLTVRGVAWHFNPPSAPHAGGLWEAAVKSMKNLLNKHLANTLLTYEEFSTLLVQIEGCLNSRPLGVLRDNTEDQSVLTPSHFLTGVPLFSNPEPEIGKCTLANRWRYVQHLKQQFSKEFKIQMVQSMQVRKKWKQPSPNLKINDVVMVDESSELANKWPLGLVKDVHPGKDGLVRVATIKMESGKLLKRPITKLAQLPLLETENSISTARSEGLSEVQPKSRYNLRKRMGKTTKMALWIGMLFTLCSLGATQQNSATLKKFENNSGLFFANIGKMKASTKDWVILLYYNMSAFQYEFEDLAMSVNNFGEKCGYYASLTSYCAMITTDMMQRISELAEDNDIIMSLNHEVEPVLRHKRMASSILPFVGSLAKAAFGTLDEGYAREMEYTIANLQRDDKHMMGLIRNHTSIMETFLNNARLSQDKTDRQFQWVSENMRNFENAIQTVEEQNVLVMRLQLLATHLSNRMHRLETAQSSIIQCVTNAQHGNFRAILHPAVLKEQLKIMKTSLSADLTIPVTSDNMIRLYSLLSVHTRVSDNFILFKFTLPLVTMNKYELFKPIPLPMKVGQDIVIIQPSVEFIAVSLHREKYIEISSSELSQCAQLDEETSLCKEHRPEMKNIPIYNSCEMMFFVHQTINTENCKLITISTRQMWIQLPSPNQWVFSTFEPEHFNIICDDDVHKLTIEGEGIITMNPKCVLENKAFTIPGVEGFSTTIINQFYFPEVNLPLSDLAKESSVLHLNTNRSSVMLRNTDDLLDIQQALGNIKQNQELPSVTTVRKMSISNMVLTIVVTMCLMGVGACKAWMWYKKPVAAPRRIHQPQLSLQNRQSLSNIHQAGLSNEHESISTDDVDPPPCPLKNLQY